MARPKKDGLDYFPLDVDIFSDEKIVPISVEFGLKGEVAVIRLLCAIYRSGYFAVWDDALRTRLLREMPTVSDSLLDQVVNRLVRWGFFNEALFDSVKVLTSEGIQRRWLHAVRKRRARDLSSLPYLLISPTAATAVPEDHEPESKPAHVDPAPPTPAPAPVCTICGPEANSQCLDRFFAEANRANLDALAMQLGLSPDAEDAMHRWAGRIVTEWNVTEKAHNGYSDWASHLVRLMRDERTREASATSAPSVRRKGRGGAAAEAAPPAADAYLYGGGFGGQDT